MTWVGVTAEHVFGPAGTAQLARQAESVGGSLPSAKPQPLRIQRVKLTDLDTSVVVRATRIDPDHLKNMVKAHQRGVEFPPLVVFHDKSDVLADGQHRREMYLQEGQSHAMAIVLPGGPREAFLYVLQLDQSLKRTNADKQHCVDALLKDSEWVTWSNAVLADKANVDEKTVAAARRRLDLQKLPRKSRDGRSYKPRASNPEIPDCPPPNKPQERPADEPGDHSPPVADLPFATEVTTTVVDDTAIDAARQKLRGSAEAKPVAEADRSAQTTLSGGGAHDSTLLNGTHWYPHVNTDHRVWLPWLGFIQLAGVDAIEDHDERAGIMAEYPGPACNEILYACHELCSADLIYGPYLRRAHESSGLRLGTLRQRGIEPKQLSGDVPDLAVALAYWTDAATGSDRRVVRSVSIGWVSVGQMPEWWLCYGDDYLFAHRTPAPEHVVGFEIIRLAGRS